MADIDGIGGAELVYRSSPGSNNLSFSTLNGGVSSPTTLAGSLQPGIGEIIGLADIDGVAGAELVYRDSPGSNSLSFSTLNGGVSSPNSLAGSLLPGIGEIIDLANILVEV